MSVIVGIDPGLSGAVAVVDTRRAGAGRVFATPTTILSSTKTEVDEAALLHLLLDLEEGEPSLVVIEKVGGQPGWGSVASFTFGQSYGAARAVIAIGGWERIDVRPQAWKKAVLGPGPKWSKALAVEWARKQYPKTSLRPAGSRSDSHDWAEALCLAHYGVMQCQKAR